MRQLRIGSVVRLVASFGICFAAAAVGSLLTQPALPVWYAELAKPSWTPPNGIFPPVWTALFATMAIALWLVWTAPGVPASLRQPALTAFTLQLGLNVGWSLLFFRLRMPGAALVEILVFWLAILASIVAFGRVRRLACWLLYPYLAWVTYAVALNLAIWRMNLAQ